MAESKLAFLKENLQTEQQSIFEPEIRKKKKAGRKPKVKGKRLSSRVTFLLSSSDAEVLKLKRRAGELGGEMDESTFIREWLTRTGMFDRRTIKDSALENLPPK